MKDLSQKKIAAQSIVISAILIFGALLITLQYTMAARAEVALLKQSAQDAKNRFDHLKSHGPTQEDIVSFPAISRLSATEQGRIATLLIKPSSETATYDEWLESQVASTKDPAAQAIAQARKAQLSSVIPVLSEVSVNGSQETLSLSQFLSYIESEWLAKRNLVSYSELGFAQVAKAEVSTGALSDVLVLPVTLDLKGMHKDIYDLLLDLHGSGDFSQEVFSQTGVVALPSVSSLSNPLIRIKNFSASEIPKADSLLTLEAKMELELFVRSPSLAQYSEMLGALERRANEQKTLLSTQIKQAEEAKDQRKLELLRSYDREVSSYISRLDPSAFAVDPKDPTTPINQIDTLSRELRSLESRISRMSI